MHLTNFLVLAAACLTATVSAQVTFPLLVNATQEFKLRSCLKPAQTQANISRFEGLHLTTYHVGAGLSATVFNPPGSGYGLEAYFNGSAANSWGAEFYGMLVNTSTQYPYAMIVNDYGLDPSGTRNYTRQTVSVNIAGSKPGFFMNDTGLQWTSSFESPGTVVDLFRGWYACDGLNYVGFEPQLFWRSSNGTVGDAVSSEFDGCAEIYLMPEFF